MSGKTILFIGNHFKSAQSNLNIWHELPIRLDQAGWKVLKTSVFKNKFIRLMNMLYIIYSKRRVYKVAEIDVFSGAAFIFAELSSFLLRRLKKPFVLNLRGGNLPDFSQRHTKRVSRILASADKVVCPSSYLQKRLINIRADIQVIPNPITIDNHKFVVRFDPKPDLIWIRAFHKIYNPSLAPQVLKKLIQFRPNARLIMIGPDKGDGALQRMLVEAESLDVESYLELPGSIDRCQGIMLLGIFFAWRKIGAKLNNPKAVIKYSTIMYPTNPRIT